MANNNQNINSVTFEPTMLNLLDYFKKQIKLEFMCHHIGTIQSFDPSNQTASATINYTKTFQTTDPVSGNTTVVTQNYPVLVMCPVVCLGGGTGSLTFPIAAGDECIILFNDRDIGDWFAGSANSAPASGRLHSFADALILVGVRSLPNVLPDYSAEGVVLSLGQNKVTIFADSIVLEVGPATLTLASDGTFSVENANSEFVFDIIQLFTDIQNGLVNTLLGPQPLVMPTYATDLEKLETFQS